MQIGFIGLGAVVETAYLPALRRLGYRIDSCQGYDLDSSRALPGIQRRNSLSALLAEPLDTLFIIISPALACAGEGVSQRHSPHRGGETDCGQP